MKKTNVRVRHLLFLAALCMGTAVPVQGELDAGEMARQKALDAACDRARVFLDAEKAAGKNVAAISLALQRSYTAAVMWQIAVDSDRPPPDLKDELLAAASVRLGMESLQAMEPGEMRSAIMEALARQQSEWISWKQRYELKHYLDE